MRKIEGRLPETWFEAVEADRVSAGLSVPQFGQLFGKEKTWAYDMLHGEASPGMEGLEILVRGTGGWNLFDWLARLAGAVWAPLQPAESALEQTADTLQEVSEYLRELAGVRDENGRVSALQLARVKKEGWEAIRAMAAQMQALERESLRIVDGRANSLAAASMMEGGR
ncbi:MAG: hypothetical protein HYV27_15125 [Candidatus Hydrogenedentes bacterium]|nr:hypothetical protein [Candidatus Hydrogenedentota bacterium]